MPRRRRQRTARSAMPAPVRCWKGNDPPHPRDRGQRVRRTSPARSMRGHRRCPVMDRRVFTQKRNTLVVSAAVKGPHLEHIQSGHLSSRRPPKTRTVHIPVPYPHMLPQRPAPPLAPPLAECHRAIAARCEQHDPSSPTRRHGPATTRSRHDARTGHAVPLLFSVTAADDDPAAASTVHREPCSRPGTAGHSRSSVRRA